MTSDLSFQEFFIVKKEGEESLLVAEDPSDTVTKSKSGSYKLEYDMNWTPFEKIQRKN